MKFAALLFGAILLALGFAGYFVPPDPGDANAGSPAGYATDQSASELDLPTGAEAKSGAAASDDQRGSSSHDAAKPSITALIPAFFGALLILCGIAALSPAWTKHAMHVAAGIALLGFIAAGGRGLTKIGPLLANDPSVNRRATIFVLVMALICLVYLLLSVRSFVAARKRASKSLS